MKKALAPLLVGAVVLVLAFVLNPSPERHRDRIKEAIGERSSAMRTLGLGSLAAFLSSYRSLGVASYTTLNGRTASVGLFGMVFVLAGASGK